MPQQRLRARTRRACVKLAITAQRWRYSVDEGGLERSSAGARSHLPAVEANLTIYAVHEFQVPARPATTTLVQRPSVKSPLYGRASRVYGGFRRGRFPVRARERRAETAHEVDTFMPPNPRRDTTTE